MAAQRCRQAWEVSTDVHAGPISPIYYWMLRNLFPALATDPGLAGVTGARCPPRIIVFLGSLSSHLASFPPITPITLRLSEREAKHLSHNASWARVPPSPEQRQAAVVMVRRSPRATVTGRDRVCPVSLSSLPPPPSSPCTHTSAHTHHAHRYLHAPCTHYTHMHTSCTNVCTYMHTGAHIPCAHTYSRTMFTPYTHVHKLHTNVYTHMQTDAHMPYAHAYFCTMGIPHTHAHMCTHHTPLHAHTCTLVHAHHVHMHMHAPCTHPTPMHTHAHPHAHCTHGHTHMYIYMYTHTVYFFPSFYYRPSLASLHIVPT